MKRSAIGAAIIAVNRLFDAVDDELDLPVEREEWDEEDYEEERDAIGRKLVMISGRMARLRGRLRNTARQRDYFRGVAHQVSAFAGSKGRQSALSSNIAIQTAPGTQAVVIPLESGVYLVAEASSGILNGAGAEKVSKALQQSAQQNLLSGPGGSRQHWTEKL